MIAQSRFICNCKCVSKKEIVNAVRKHGAQSFSEVRTITTATTGCGRCKPAVEGIVGEELSMQKVRIMQLRINFGD
ncbi:MAG: (2Fe-2S)-binding protein [Bacteroidales bacterium]